jgi:hypothetical protein
MIRDLASTTGIDLVRHHYLPSAGRFNVLPALIAPEARQIRREIRQAGPLRTSACERATDRISALITAAVHGTLDVANFAI